jgi:hypothetical protein
MGIGFVCSLASLLAVASWHEDETHPHRATAMLFDTDSMPRPAEAMVLSDEFLLGLRYSSPAFSFSETDQPFPPYQDLGAWALRPGYGDSFKPGPGPARLHVDLGFPQIAGAFLLVGGASLFDEGVREWAQDHRTEGWDRFFDRIEPINNSYDFEKKLVMFGLFSQSDRILEMSVVALEARFFCTRIVRELKSFVGRKRPKHCDDAFEFGHHGNRSFPSGHTIALAPTVVVLSRYLDSTLFDIAGYTLLGLKAMQRIVSDNHWLSDTLASIMIGYFVGNWLVDLHQLEGPKLLPWVIEVDEGEPVYGLQFLVG